MCIIVADKISMPWAAIFFRTSKQAENQEAYIQNAKWPYQEFFHYVPGDTQNPCCLSRRNRRATSWRQVLLNSVSWMLLKMSWICFLKWWSILKCWSVSTSSSCSTGVVQASKSSLIFFFSWFAFSVIHSSDFYIHREISLLGSWKEAYVGAFGNMFRK